MTNTAQAGTSVPAAGPRRIDRRQLLLHAIRRERGEWTVGLVKHTYRRLLGHRHIYRSTIRRDLAALHSGGHLERHDAPARRFYTYTAKGGTA
jgi:hypothetical protein